MLHAARQLRNIGLQAERIVKEHRWLLRIRHCRSVRDDWYKAATIQYGPQSNPRSVPSASDQNADAPRCLLDLQRIANDGEQGRRFHALVRMLQRGGYQVSLVPRLRFLQTGRRAFKQSALASIEPFRPTQGDLDQTAFDLCLSDCTFNHPLAARTIYVDSGRRRPVAGDSLAMPYTIYPEIWDTDQDRQFTRYRQQTKLWRLFFGGHCSQASYQRIRKYRRLAVTDRYTLISSLKRAFSDFVVQVENESDLSNISRERVESCVMIDSAVFRIPADQWLGLLSKSDFFLAAPGCDYPLSHNAIEAMAVGSIPVLEYASLFTPALQHGVNCIAYKGLHGFGDAVQAVREMPSQQIQAMRRSVIDYYETHLSPAAFCRNLLQPEFKSLHLFPYLTPSPAKSQVA